MNNKEKIAVNNFNSKSKPNLDLAKPPKKLTTFEKWKLSQNVSLETKVFLVDFNYPDVAESLKSRGWYQNPDPESNHFDLKYSRCARIPKNLLDWQTLNHFPRNYNLSAKWNLCETIKKNENLTKVNHLSYFPRCFQMENEDLTNFMNTYKLIYSLSIVKRFLINPSVSSASNISACILLCKKWVKDIKFDSPKPLAVTIAEWNEIISESKGLPVEESSIPALITEATKVTKSLQKLDPQFDLIGMRNIWIIKPGRKSRGRDIKILCDLREIKEYVSSPNYWVAQKYIENPLLINSRKFDIRQWVLITSFDPIVIWIYKKCYLRFTVEEFSFDDLGNNFMHLTNNSISKESSKFENSEDWGYMWDLDQFRQFLFNTYGRDVWDESLFAQVKRVIVSSILTVGKLTRKNSFELLGFDLMVDDTLKPWLIEVNTSPAMDYSTVSFK